MLPAFEPLRVASHTDMTAAVKFSLENLATASKRPLVLHTLPPPPPPPPSSSSSPEPEPSTSAAQISSKQVETAVDAIPKLVSILEIIKREFPSCSGTSGGAKPNDLPPLHQYTRLTTFETALDFQHLPFAEIQAEDRDLEAVRQELVQLEWLSGRAGKAKRPRKRHSPCMLVVLSREPLSALAKSPHYTYQKPMPRSKKRPRTVLPEEAMSSEALPLTSTPLPGQGTNQRGRRQALPDPSQAGAAHRPTKSAANDSAGKSVPAATSVAGGEAEEQTMKKKKPNRRRTRRKPRQETETAGDGPTAEGGQAAEASAQRMDISA
ncbi:hypothetical protein C6P46_003645 [Rhodotorula mucilaginosa]|uniref:Uncharacterized protein n=1 Tax=Rhodotorula mucilaginosa TaxID=5537 RepID=A0A9P6W8I1_RHOMI|nr:hypothetical protein C6P46_003645 [Rhodotorula mucilaginosa]TKA53835.1 hypothetical protein B0A53_03625 [Rhodotorula sp. CCFEE 5036]